MREFFFSHLIGLSTQQKLHCYVFSTTFFVSLGSGNVCLRTLLDLSAAFDTIDGGIFLRKAKI